MLHEFRTSFCRLTCVAGLSDKIGTQTHTHTHPHAHAHAHTHTHTYTKKEKQKHTAAYPYPEYARKSTGRHGFKARGAPAPTGHASCTPPQGLNADEAGSSRDLHRTLAEMHQAAKRELKASSDPLRAMNSHRNDGVRHNHTAKLTQPQIQFTAAGIS